MFRTADGRNLLTHLCLITSLFLLWGFCNGMIDILNKHFQDTLRINKERSGLVQAANYLAYFLMAIPVGFDREEIWLQRRHNRRSVVDCSRRFLVHSGYNIGTYWAFLLGLFVIAAGMTCLETIANPYATVLGSPESGPTRINIAQTTNGAWMDSGADCGRVLCFLRR